MAYLPKNCLVIEDSPAGIEAALTAKMHVIGFLGGTHTHYDWYQEKITHYPIPVAYSAQELADLWEPLHLAPPLGLLSTA